MRRWHFSLLMLLTYVFLFLFWRYFPSRMSFVGGSLFAVGFLGYRLVLAKRQGYFVDRVDLWLHLYVLVDLLLEGFAWEGLRQIFPSQLVGNAWLDQWVERFHHNTNYIGCTLVLSTLIGGYRTWQLWTRRREASLVVLAQDPLPSQRGGFG